MGRWFNNLSIEKLGHSVKYEDIYLRAYETPAAPRPVLTRYFNFYSSRRHAALDRRIPGAVLSRCLKGATSNNTSSESWR